MPTRNVNLTDAQDRFVADRVASGKYENASEVVRAALRELERHEANDALKMERLRRLLEEGEASGVAEDFSLDGILAELDGQFAAGGSVRTCILAAPHPSPPTGESRSAAT